MIKIDPMAVIAAATSIAALLIYFAFKLDKNEHPILQLLLIGVVFLTLMLIPKAVIDTPYYCETVVLNQSIIETQVNPTLKTDIITNVYGQYCLDEKNTGVLLYKLSVWLFRIFVTYMFCYMLYLVFAKKIKKEVQKIFGRGKNEER